jgi:hypothetical protein
MIDDWKNGKNKYKLHFHGDGNCHQIHLHELRNINEAITCVKQQQVKDCIPLQARVPAALLTIAKTRNPLVSSGPLHVHCETLCIHEKEWKPDLCSNMDKL